MVNHPNRAKVYPDSTLADACRKAGASVRLMWEIPGPKDTLIAWMSCYSIDSGLCIVQTFKQGGWEAFTNGTSNQVSKTVEDVLARCSRDPIVPDSVRQQQ